MSGSGGAGGAGARPTPYELVFTAAAEADVAGAGEAGVPETRLDEIRLEARQRSVDTSDPQRLVQLASAGALLRTLIPADADPDVLLDMGLLLFQAYHFRLFGSRVYTLEQGLARRLLAPKAGGGAGAEAGTGPPAAAAAQAAGGPLRAGPAPAGYLQLPRQLVWARVSESGIPEPVDGLFWTLVGQPRAEAPPFSRIDVLLVLGMRSGRPGFSVVGVGAPLAELAGGGWERPRPDGAEFGNILPGGELSGLHGLVSETEVLKLVALVFGHLAARPDSLVEVGAAVAGERTGPVLHRFRIRDAGGRGS